MIWLWILIDTICHSPDSIHTVIFGVVFGVIMFEIYMLEIQFANSIKHHVIYLNMIDNIAICESGIYSTCKHNNVYEAQLFFNLFMYFLVEQ